MPAGSQRFTRKRVPAPIALPNRLLTPWLAALALLALAFNVLVPQGFMTVAGSGGIRIVICTGAGAVTALVAADADHPHGDTARGHAQDCAFAGHAAPPAPPLAPALLLQRFAIVAAPVAAWRIGLFPGRGMAAPPPPSQAPPASHD